jgi:hypothetical protein
MEQKRRQALQQVEVCKLLAANVLRVCDVRDLEV